MKIDQTRLTSIRVPVTGIVLLIAAATVVFVLPRPSSTARPGTVAIEPGETATTIKAPAPTTVPATETSQAPTPTTPEVELDIPAPEGGVKPQWPAWVTATDEVSAARSYKATLTLPDKTLDQLLVWLSIQGWIATASGDDSTTWSLASGGRHFGTIQSSGPDIFLFDVVQR